MATVDLIVTFVCVFGMCAAGYYLFDSFWNRTSTPETKETRISDCGRCGKPNPEGKFYLYGYQCGACDDTEARNNKKERDWINRNHTRAERDRRFGSLYRMVKGVSAQDELRRQLVVEYKTKLGELPSGAKKDWE